MVRPIRRSRGLYTAKMTKATDTLSGFSTWENLSPRERQKSAMLTPYDIRNKHWTRGCCCTKGA